MKVLRIFFIIASAGLLMGNEGCDDKPKERLLRQSVEAGKIDGQVIKLPDGRIIDFPFVANTLFNVTVMRDPHFIMDRPITIGHQEMSENKYQKPSPVPMDDEKILKRYGFSLDQAKKPIKASSKGGGFTTFDCLHYTPEVRLTGAVVSLELIAGGGVSVGFRNGLPIGGKTGGVGGSLHFELSRLDVALKTEEPLSNRPIAVDLGQSYETKVDAGLNYMGMIGLDFFFKTPLVNIILDAFQEALTSLVTVHQEKMNAKSWNEVWRSKVILDPVMVDGDTHIAMRGGWRAGVRKDDQFNVYNMHYQWVGEKCASDLDYAMPTPTTPIAEVKIVEVGQDVSIARVSKVSGEHEVEYGAIVRVQSLAPEGKE